MPAALDILGTADPQATVNNQATNRKGEYFHKELTLDNSSAQASRQIQKEEITVSDMTGYITGGLNKVKYLAVASLAVWWFDSNLDSRQQRKS